MIKFTVEHNTMDHKTSDEDFRIVNFETGEIHGFCDKTLAMALTPNVGVLIFEVPPHTGVGYMTLQTMK
jgi:hypothetical protein